jgi:hypothetical protein
MTATERTFTALMRWHGPDPTIEIETRHLGFRAPETAALFANGFPPNAPLGLLLTPDKTVQLLLKDDDYVDWHGADVTVWVLSAGRATGDELIAWTEGQPKPFAEFTFPPPAFGRYHRTGFAVLDQDGLRVELAVDLICEDRIRVIIHQAATDEDVPAFFFMGALPKA